MTFSQSNGIQIELVNPNTLLYPTRVYPIPKRKVGVNMPIKFHVSINHTNSNNFHLNSLQAFIPELLTLDGKIIQGRLGADKAITNNQSKQYNWWRIIPNCRTTFIVTARLFWQENSLQLKIPAVPDYVLGSVSPAYFWYFDALAAETYQLRFILNTDLDTQCISKPNISQEENAQKASSEILATPWVNLRLVQTLLFDSRAIEVDGVLFKIEMAKSLLTIPSKLFRTKTDVKLGIHVTNNTLNPLRFNQAHSIDVILISDDGKEINWLSDMVRPGLGKEPRYYLVQPGESAYFDSDAMLSWYCNKLELAVSNKARGLTACGFYYFSNLKKGGYKMQVIYRSCQSRAKHLEEQVLEKKWTGWVAMPFIEFYLV
ncbi:hypothetical protein NIES4071_79330 [Calothrix sp. NIES-4071]|nr:hypothetical protein NIES4071_79330 [Calothrix sp. NIES-4071]BAZ62203.1 hypothetical protein NIES4105_79260 [Calothrix sp. NIES-4105]